MQRGILLHLILTSNLHFSHDLPLKARLRKIHASCHTFSSTSEAFASPAWNQALASPPPFQLQQLNLVAGIKVCRQVIEILCS